MLVQQETVRILRQRNKVIQQRTLVEPQNGVFKQETITQTPLQVVKVTDIVVDHGAVEIHTKEIHSTPLADLLRQLEQIGYQPQARRLAQRPVLRVVREDDGECDCPEGKCSLN